MPVDFRDYFWGEKNNGFDVLYHNMKYGQTASKELADFFRERSVIEEAQSKLLTKLAKQAGSACSNGTFAPLWQVLKVSTEKLSSLHSEMVQRIQDLVKEVHKYCDEQHKKHKLVKEEESGTLEVVQSIQQTITSLSKSKETYNSRCLEVEKLRKENSSPKDFEKAELKCKKACEDYKSYVEKYSHVREEFQKKMTVSCQHFQKIEEDHLNQMKEFLSNYAHVLESGHTLIGQVHVEFQQQCNDMDIEKLLEQFITSKGTGSDHPGPVSFEEADLSSISQVSSTDTSQIYNGENPSKKEGKKMSLHHKSKPSCRTTSLLDLFFPSSLGGGHDIDISPTPSQNVTPTAVLASSTPGSTSENNEQLSRTTFRGSKCNNFSIYLSIYL